MKLFDRIFYEKVDDPAALDAEERAAVTADPELSLALRENRALSDLRPDPGPAPDRARMLAGVYHEAEMLEEPRMSLLKRLFEGKRWYAQAGLALGILLVITALAVFMPADTSLKPTQAWARTDGYRLNYNLGQAPPELLQASLAGPGPVPLVNAADGGGRVKTVKVITAADLTPEELAELQESLGLVIDGDMEVVRLEDLKDAAGVVQGGMIIYVTDPDEAKIEELLAGAVGEAVELDEIHLMIGEDGVSREMMMLISRPEGGSKDTAFAITVDGDALTENLADLRANLEEVRINVLELDLAGVDSEIALAMEEARNGLLTVQGDSIYMHLDPETLAEVKVALAEARVELEKLDLSELKDLQSIEGLAALEDAWVELDKLDLSALPDLAGIGGLEELQKIWVDLDEVDPETLKEWQQFKGLENLDDLEHLAVINMQDGAGIDAAIRELQSLDLEALGLTIEQQAQVAEAREQLKSLSVVSGAEDGPFVLRIGEVSTVDLGEIESAVDNLKFYRVNQDGAPVDVETQIVDGELITSICIVGDDAEALKELQWSLSQTVTDLPEPEVETSTWFHYPDSTAEVSTDGMVISIDGHSFTFPAGASAGEIQRQLKRWAEENGLEGSFPSEVKSLQSVDGKPVRIVVLSDGAEFTISPTKVEKVDGRYVVVTGDQDVVSAYTVVVSDGEEDGEKVVEVTINSTDDEETEEKEPAGPEKKEKQK